MSSPQNNLPRSTWESLKDLIANPYLSGFATLVGLIAAIRADDLLIRIPSLMIFVVFGWNILVVARPWIYNKMAWVTRQHVATLLFGIIIGAILSPLIFQPALSLLLSLVAPDVEFVDSFPENDGAIPSVYSSVRISFSEPIPWPYDKFINIEISPAFPTVYSWSHDHRLLYIYPNKFFPANQSRGILNPRFEYSSVYEIRVDGPALVTPVYIRFYTSDR